MLQNAGSVCQRLPADDGGVCVEAEARPTSPAEVPINSVVLKDGNERLLLSPWMCLYLSGEFCIPPHPHASVTGLTPGSMNCRLLVRSPQL